MNAITKAKIEKVNNPPIPNPTETMISMVGIQTIAFVAPFRGRVGVVSHFPTTAALTRLPFLIVFLSSNIIKHGKCGHLTTYVLFLLGVLIFLDIFFSSFLDFCHGFHVLIFSEEEFRNRVIPPVVTDFPLNQTIFGFFDPGDNCSTAPETATAVEEDKQMKNVFVWVNGPISKCILLL